jgi:hypothetical protein
VGAIAQHAGQEGDEKKYKVGFSAAVALKRRNINRNNLNIFIS